MSVLWCTCGNDISDRTDGLPYKARFISDETYQLTQGGWERIMYECHVCGRLWIQANPRDNQYLSYLPESPRRGILREAGASEEE
jgi:hypothetical protein